MRPAGPQNSLEVSFQSSNKDKKGRGHSQRKLFSSHHCSSVMRHGLKYVNESYLKAFPPSAGSLAALSFSPCTPSAHRRTATLSLCWNRKKSTSHHSLYVKINDVLGEDLWFISVTVNLKTRTSSLSAPSFMRLLLHLCPFSHHLYFPLSRDELPLSE